MIYGPDPRPWPPDPRDLAPPAADGEARKSYFKTDNILARYFKTDDVLARIFWLVARVAAPLLMTASFQVRAKKEEQRRCCVAGLAAQREPGPVLGPVMDPELCQ